jgi:serine/threonine protein kinase
MVSSPMAETLINQSVGPYVVREPISAGGVAEVFRVQHRTDHSVLALKVLRPERQAEKHHLKAFNDEFDLLSRLDHPGIPKARRREEIKGRACILMDFVPGQTLHALQSHAGRFDAITAFLQLTGITAYLHREGVVHNDLKLENAILRPDGSLALVDFGNARIGQKKGIFARLLGKREPTFGTPTYLAPELISGEGSPSFRSDCYSLAVCCFILLSGEPPFNYDRKSARLRAAVNQAAPTLRGRVPSVSSSFSKLVDTCLAKDPAQRLDSAEVLHNGLKLVLKASGVHAVKAIDI